MCWCLEEAGSSMEVFQRANSRGSQQSHRLYGSIALQHLSAAMSVLPPMSFFLFLKLIHLLCRYDIGSFDIFFSDVSSIF